MDLTASISINCKLDAVNNFASLDPYSFTCPLFPDSFIHPHLLPDNKVYSTEKSFSTKCRPRNPNQMFL